MSNNEQKKPDQGQGGTHGHDTVSIHIDKQNLKSPTPTTGHALYILGNVDATKYDLFLEVPGKGDDVLIANDGSPIDVKNGSHFYTAQNNLNPGA